MKDLKKMLEETNGLYSKIDHILKSSTYDDYDDLSGLDIDYRDGEQLFLLEELQSIMRNLGENSAWNLGIPYFFQNKVFYWGAGRGQQEVYVIEEGETILSLNKFGSLWEAETIAIPWIHHSQQVQVHHSKFSGTVEVVKTIVRSDDTGAVHMYIYFEGG